MKKLIFACILLSLAGAAALAQTITVTSPNGSENWALGSLHAITWTSSGVAGNVRILPFKGGNNVGIIQDDVPVAQGAINWTVGNYRGGPGALSSPHRARPRPLPPGSELGQQYMLFDSFR